MTKQKDKISHYTSQPQENRFILFSFIDRIKEVIEYRELLFNLFKRDFFMDYKKSFLGYAWILFGPFIAIINWVIMNSSGILSPGEMSIPYPVYVLVGTTLWGLFISTCISVGNTYKDGETLMVNINFPHIIIVTKLLLQIGVNFLISITINILAILLFGIHFSLLSLLFMFILLIPLLLLGISIGIFQATALIIIPDIAKMIPILLNFLMYFTPIIFIANVKSLFLKKAITLNPLTYLISAPRDILLYNHFSNWQIYLIISGVTLILFSLFIHFFQVTSKIIVEKLSFN